MYIKTEHVTEIKTILSINNKYIITICPMKFIVKT